jgi:hypothetical protein
MPVARGFGGVLYSGTGILTGYDSLYMMMQTVNGGAWSWWSPAMLGAAILLMIAGIHALAPRLGILWLSLVAVAIPLGICSLAGEWPLVWLISAAVLGLLAWAILRIEAGLRRGDVAAFSVSILMIVSWASASVNTVRSAVAASSPGSYGVVLGVLVFFWVLIIAVAERSGRSVFSARANQ